jgi:hypothetical protein
MMTDLKRKINVLIQEKNIYKQYQELISFHNSNTFCIQTDSDNPECDKRIFQLLSTALCPHFFTPKDYGSSTSTLAALTFYEGHWVKEPQLTNQVDRRRAQHIFLCSH